MTEKQIKTVIVLIGLILAVGSWATGPHQVMPRTGIDWESIDLSEYEITAASPLWNDHPTAAMWLADAISHKLMATFEAREGNLTEANRHETIRAEDIRLAKEVIEKAR